MFIGLFWLGSVGGSLVVLVLGLLTGEHSGEIQLSVLLNLPFVLVSVLLYAAQRFSLNSCRCQHAFAFGRSSSPATRGLLRDR